LLSEKFEEKKLVKWLNFARGFKRKKVSRSIERKSFEGKSSDRGTLPSQKKKKI